MEKIKCEMCKGDGISRCDNPDHGFISAVGREISRIGCPVCGHDEEYKVYGEECDACNGTGFIVELVQEVPCKSG